MKITDTMKNLDEILNPAWKTKLNYSLGLSSQISEMLRVKDRFTGVSKMAEIAAGINPRNLFSNFALSEMETFRKFSSPQSMINAIDRSLYGSMVSFPKRVIDTQDYSWRSKITMSHSMAQVMDSLNKTKMTIPQSVFDSISSIGIHHQKLLETLRSLDGGLKYKSLLQAQINNFDFAFRGVSERVAAIAANERNWGLIEDFSSVTEQAVEFAESITEESDEKVNSLFQILWDLINSFIEECKDINKKPLQMLLVIATLHQYYYFLTKPDAESKEGINRLEKKNDKLQTELDSLNSTIHSLTNVFRQYKSYRITNRNCKVKLKPKIKSTTLSILPESFEVLELKIHHKWVYVSYFDSMDNLPKMGWIMKKYLNKP